ncbi:hypothetical protein ACHAW5_007436 [Stephanodiscus triporus]|uniref:Replication protein A C-terminal domain-containing protein n=1 Tax=Stephanodiscus triporus TaxID=2934178 RepID=A0ABD3PU61_9STRA
MSGFGGGFDNGGDTPSRGGGSSDGAKPRRNYDEQTLIPVTARMVHSALGDPSGGTDLTLSDGRPLHMVKLVAAVRNHEERSTNVFIDVEDGTGLVSVKVWVNEGDECSAAAALRRDAATDHTYIRVIGQVREFDGQRQIVANDVRPVSSGNELTYHLLEVAHSYEKHLRMQSDAATGMGMGMGMGMGVGIGKMASVAPPRGGMGMGAQGYGGGPGVGSGLDDAIIQVIKTMGPNSGSGIHVDEITAQVASQGYSAMEIKNVINNLSNEGHIYSTIDENHYQYAE